MHLTPQEVKRFYTIWFPLLHYVNQRRKLVPSFPKEWSKAGSVSPEVAAPLRDALWEDDALREAFIADNPAHLSQDDLALVTSWKHRIADSFFIFRYLKKYAVFISGDSPPQGYGVLGLTDSIEDMIGPYLPIYVRAVLLPFEDRIIYDSLLAPYPVMFGGGYRSSLKETYREIQERGGIVTSLRPEDQGDKLDRIQASNKKVLAAFQKALGKAGLSPKMMTEHPANLTKFADEFLLRQPSPAMLLDISRQHIEAYAAAQTGKVNLVSFKRFVWFLRDTYRIDWDDAEDLLDYLKRVQSE